jgi:hypothetical protein
MRKLQHAIYKRETGSAGGKAKNDAFDIMEQCGFEPTYHPSSYRQLRILQQIYSIGRLKGSDALVLQYPAVSNIIMEKLKKKLNKVSLSVALVHDLPSIQGMGGKKEKEFKFLSHFDCLIVHNKMMADYLSANGYCGKIIELELFDYLHDISKPVMAGENNGTICIAGNLDKSRYVCDLNKITKYSFNLYGINKTLNLSNISNVAYKGLLNSEEIVYKLDGDYGLVWDGDSIEGCLGTHGRYLLYNNPHKLSLYIAAGKPIITWKKAAIANFVKEENIGFTVNSLLDLNDIDLIRNYEIKKSNVLKLKSRVAEGYYLKTAINKIFVK